MTQELQNHGWRVWHPVGQWNLLPPLVACLWVEALAIVERVYVPMHTLLALAIGVWMIYTLDGLMDSVGRKEGSEGTLRRDFHWKHRRVLWILWVVVGVGWLSFSLRELSGALVLAGLVMAVPLTFCLIHAQWLRHARYALIPKELFTGFFFAAGVVLVVIEAQGFGMRGNLSLEAAQEWFRAGQGGMWVVEILFSLLVTIVLETFFFDLGLLFSLNCLLTGWHEMHDKNEDEGSASRLFPLLARKAPLIVVAVILSSLLKAYRMEEMDVKMVSLTVALAGGLMLVVHQFAKHGKIPRDGVAIFLDLALFAPLFLFSLEKMRT